MKNVNPKFHNFQASYYIIFDNIRARGSLKILSRMLFDKTDFLTKILEQERTNNQFAHLFLDLTVGQKEKLRVRVGWPFTDEMYVFTPD